VDIGRVYSALFMMQSLELMSKFHAMCECDTWEEISRKLHQTRADVEAVVSELEFVLGKKLIHRRADGDVVSNFSSRFFMPTDSGMKWYLLIGELLRNVALEGFSTEGAFLHIMKDLLQSLNNKSSSSTGFFVTFSFFSSGLMQNLKIFSNDFYSYNYLEPILSKMLQQYGGMSFSILSHESECLNEFDAYLLSYEFPAKDFISQTLVEGRLGLYAHPAYLARVGTPKKIEDLNNHTMFRSRATLSANAIGAKKFGVIKGYAPIWCKKNYIDVDSSASLIRFAEMGAGIISMNEVSAKKLSVKLERLAPLQEETEFLYRKYIFGFHQKHKDNPLITDLARELHDIFN
jgi:DNA-binding transcriptional LysR family regulator